LNACPDKQSLIHGLLDGELDAANVLACEAHLRTCPGCAAELERLNALRELLASAELRPSAPEPLRARIEALIDAETRATRPSWRARAARNAPWAASGVFAALAASLALVMLAPQASEGPLESELVAGHVRSLLAAHLTDVATSNRHVVKPWFNGKIDFAPQVVDLADRGFPLAGGRLDYIHGRVVAALVYRRRLHAINLFVWPAGHAGEAALAARKDGYSLTRWVQGGLEYWAVSDIDAADLQAFKAAFVASTAS
jgi:anti-sigma factor RsiW